MTLAKIHKHTFEKFCIALTKLFFPFLSGNIVQLDGAYATPSDSAKISISTFDRAQSIIVITFFSVTFGLAGNNFRFKILKMQHPEYFCVFVITIKSCLQSHYSCNILFTIYLFLKMVINGYVTCT